MQELFKHLDYSEYGGAPLLGVKGVTIICHGASAARHQERHPGRRAGRASRMSEHIGAGSRGAETAGMISGRRRGRRHGEAVNPGS